MRHRLLQLCGSALLALFIAGCGGDDGAQGPKGDPGEPGQDVDPAVVAALEAKIKALTQAVNPETCVTCHTGEDPVARTGPMHQARYKEFYIPGVVNIVPGSIAIATNGVDTTTLTFKMTKNGQDFSCLDADASGGYYDPYDRATKKFTYPGPSIMSLKPNVARGEGTITYDGAGGCTWTKTFTAPVDTALVAALATSDGVVQIYGVDEILEVDPVRHMNNGKYPFAGVLKVGTVDYTSAANVSGCENCHTQPFLKHGYIFGKVTDNSGATTEFYTCKGCHSDARDGGHRDWQLLKDDPAKFLELTDAAAVCAAVSPATPESQACDSLNEQIGIVFGTKYDYKTRLMNDVHMSHNMEFAYPQRMTNCVTCHAGKLSRILDDSQYKAETCISCHALDDPDNEPKGSAARGPGLKTMMAAADFKHANILASDASLRGTDCSAFCHKDGGAAPTFKSLHKGGYDPIIYTAGGTRYSDSFKVTIDSATVADNKLTVRFSATEAPDIAGYAVTDIVPTVMVGLYGYDSKDFIVAAHGRDIDDNADGVIDSKDARNLEWVWGETNPRFTGTIVGAGIWEVTVDLAAWADKITDGAVKRAEIAVMPQIDHKTEMLQGRSGLVPAPLGLNAPSRTFDLAANAFDDAFMTYGGAFKSNNLVKVLKTTEADGSVTGCNTCHDQLATTFHSGIRGGNIRVCRICHEVSNAGSHLELQSRSIDSYVHAIHSFQAFDPGDIDFGSPTESLEYQHHINSEFPRFGILNCESCHYGAGNNDGYRYNIPNQARSMPGVLSGTDEVAGRKIGAIPPAVTGPAVRACGGCHRAQKINADDPAGLAVLIQHWKTFGYAVDATDDPAGAQRSLWESVVAKIMDVFKL